MPVPGGGPRQLRSRRPHLEHEERLRAEGAGRVAGIDEVGRGPLAGPVVAAAVILPPDFRHPFLTDSKQLSPVRRATIYRQLTTDPTVAWHCAVVGPDEVDRLNVRRATAEAMRRASAGLDPSPDHVLIDGLPVHPFPFPQTAVVQGDTISLSVAAASVIAKVTRDRLMDELDALYPAYGFGRHKGYPTRAHLAVLARVGPCPIHRFSFQPVGQPLFSFARRDDATVLAVPVLDPSSGRR